MDIPNLPEKYQVIWEQCVPLFQDGRPGDAQHAREVVETVLNYAGEARIDLDVLVPVAMMHDIGHAAILPEHFKYVTGPEKVKNGKLVHMLAGAKIAHDILKAVSYDPHKSEEIVEIVSMHDGDQLSLGEGQDWRDLYDTDNKKVFHDLDSLDRYSESRLKSMAGIGYDNPKEVVDMLTKFLDNFFFSDIRAVAESGLDKIRKTLL